MRLAVSKEEINSIWLRCNAIQEYCYSEKVSTKRFNFPLKSLNCQQR